MPKVGKAKVTARGIANSPSGGQSAPQDTPKGYLTEIGDGVKKLLREKTKSVRALAHDADKMLEVLEKPEEVTIPDAFRRIGKLLDRFFPKQS